MNSPADAIFEALTKGIKTPRTNQQPNGGLLHIPGLNPAGRPPQIADAINTSIKTIAQALTTAIQENGHTIIPTHELNQLHTDLKTARNELQNLHKAATDLT
jgi:hypothetical protein